MRGRGRAAALLLLAAAMEAGVPARVEADQVIDLAQVGITYPGFRIDGIDDSDYSGYSVSGAGDVNGDGLADLIVGAPGGDPVKYETTGQSFVVFGKKDNSHVDLGELRSGGFIINGISRLDDSGISVSAAGDVNGDGLADLVVGAWKADLDGEHEAGAGYIVFGKADSATVELSALGSGGFRINATGLVFRLARCVSGAGDVNGDGLADLIVGEYRTYNAGGRSYVVFGKADSLDVDVSALGSGGFRIDGVDPYDYSGWSVSGAGDVNGDGLSDLIVGAWGVDDRGNVDSGQAYVVFGKTDSAVVDLGALGLGGFRVGGTRTNFQTGSSVSSAGDVNGDGLSDLIVGAHRATPYGRDGAGVTYVVFGKPDSASVYLPGLGTGGFRMDGVNEGDDLGTSVAGAGDVNGDGLADLIIGAHFARLPGRTLAGQSFLIFGKTDGGKPDLSALAGGGIRIDGAVDHDLSGNSVSSAGDVNGDGLADIIVGAAGNRQHFDDAVGKSFVVFSTSEAPATAIYKSIAKSGDAPSAGVGICGEGSNDSSPDSRCWIDFADGSGAGLNGSSLQTVTLTRSENEISNLPTGRANVLWRVTTNRSGWTSAIVTFRYTDAEIAGLTETNLTLYRADSLSGPWTPLTTTISVARNTASATVPGFSYFALSDPQIAASPTPSPSPTPSATLSPSPSPSYTPTLTPSPTPHPSHISHPTHTPHPTPFQSHTPGATHTPSPVATPHPTHTSRPSSTPTHSFHPRVAD